MPTLLIEKEDVDFLKNRNYKIVKDEIYMNDDERVYKEHGKVLEAE